MSLTIVLLVHCSIGVIVIPSRFGCSSRKFSPRACTPTLPAVLDPALPRCQSDRSPQSAVSQSCPPRPAGLFLNRSFEALFLEGLSIIEHWATSGSCLHSIDLSEEERPKPLQGFLPHYWSLEACLSLSSLCQSDTALVRRNQCPRDDPPLGFRLSQGGHEGSAGGYLGKNSFRGCTLGRQQQCGTLESDLAKLQPLAKLRNYCNSQIDQ
jgi:hypothetical protein